MKKNKKIELDKEEIELLQRAFLHSYQYSLKNKEHIKKYKMLRKLHKEIHESMFKYMNSDKFDNVKFHDVVADIIDNEIDEDFEITFDYDNSSDIIIECEMHFYKNSKNIKSITEMFLETNRFKSPEKKVLLQAMNSSFVGLFKIIDFDYENAYVFLEDIFTHKKFKVVDINLGFQHKMYDLKNTYFYMRIITVDDISFGTGIPSHFDINDAMLQNYIKSHKYNKCSDMARCLYLYSLYRKK